MELTFPMIGTPVLLATIIGPNVFVIGNVYTLWNCIMLPWLPWKCAPKKKTGAGTRDCNVVCTMTNGPGVPFKVGGGTAFLPVCGSTYALPVDVWHPPGIVSGGTSLEWSM